MDGGGFVGGNGFVKVWGTLFLMGMLKVLVAPYRLPGLLFINLFDSYFTSYFDLYS